MIKKKQHSASYTLLSATAMHVFTCSVLWSTFRNAAYGTLEWIILFSFAPLAAFAVMAWWFPRASSLLAAGAYAGFIILLANAGQEVFGQGLFFGKLLLTAVFIVPTSLFAVSALVSAFKKEGFVLTWKHKLLFVGMVVVVLVCVVLKPTLTFVKLYRIDQRRSHAMTIGQHIAACEDLAESFSTEELRSMSGCDPDHYLGLSMGGAAESALGLQNSLESIAALESLLREAEERMKNGVPEAERDRYEIIGGLALARDYDYQKLWDHYSADLDVLRALVIAYLYSGGRRDCDDRLFDYFSQVLGKDPSDPVAGRAANYLRDHGYEID